MSSRDVYICEPGISSIYDNEGRLLRSVYTNSIVERGVNYV